MVNQQQREPLAALFGSGTATSSDGQFFRAGGFGRDAARLNAHLAISRLFNRLPAPRSGSVRLCYKNARFVISGLPVPPLTVTLA